MTTENNRTKRSDRRILVILAIIVAAVLAVIIILLYSLMSSDGTLDPERPTERITASTQPLTNNPGDSGDAQDQTDQSRIDPEDSDPITSDEAKKIALEDAGLKESEVRMSRVKYKWDDGRQVFDVEFYSDWAEYEYNLDAVTGEILEKEVEN